MATRNKRASTMKTNLSNKIVAFTEQYTEEVKALHAFAQWSDFAASLLSSFQTYGSLTDRQLASIQSMMVKQAEKDAARNAAKASNSGNVDMAAIHAIFATAQANGLKKPKFYAGDIKISMAPSHGANAGALYVVRDPDIYQGKIVGTEFKASGSAKADTLTLLQALAADPSSYARATGKLTGQCCCCGRTLTDPESIEAGIGPICASKWGL